MRGGYGIFYAASGQSFITQQLATFFPFAITQTANRQANNPLALTLADPFSGAKAGGVSYNGFDVDAPSPYVQSYNLIVEHQLGSSSALEVSYSGSKGTHLGRIYNINQPNFDPALRLPNGTFPRPFASAPTNPINYFGFGSGSTYSAGTVTFRRRFASGFFYRVNYVYSKSIDESSQINRAGRGGFAGAQDSRNLRLERGRSDFDRGHTFTMNYSYEIPWKGSAAWGRLLKGWQLAGTGRATTGPPFTAVTSNVNTNLSLATRPDRIATGSVSNPTPERWFDIAAFPVVPATAYSLGNSGRNILDGPGTLSMNLSLIRNMRFRDKGNLQFRWEAFNAFNRANFGLPINSVNAVTSGTIVSAGAGRSMQFGLRLQI